MNSKSTRGLEWLNPNDAEQLRWAASYLAARGLLERLEHPANRPFGQQLTHEDLVRIGRRLRNSRLLFMDMRAAWRQKRYRTSENGRKTCSFTFKPETKDKLKELAEDGNESATLEALIDRAYRAKHRKGKKAGGKVERILQGDRQFTILDIKEVMNAKALPPDNRAISDHTIIETPSTTLHAAELQQRDTLPVSHIEHAELSNESTAVDSNEVQLIQAVAIPVLVDLACGRGELSVTAEHAPAIEATPDAPATRPAVELHTENAERLSVLSVRPRKRKTYMRSQQGDEQANKKTE
ncbi:MAG: hypothetical protein E2594_00255 [Pseudomonas sp.]|nr:hypothetical protein [Pseudomonas sp.]